MQKRFHHYNLTEELAKKYSHATYLAFPISEPEQQVVLTLFTTSLFQFPHEREKLLLKARSIKKLQHPHLVPILDVGIEQEQVFVVREYLPNRSLRARLKKIFPDRLKLEEALTIISQVGKALAYAHKHSILHRNIKPENILFDADGQAVLADFHLVSRNDAIIRDQTAEEYAFCYLAPEQFAGTSDPRSDQYALGCLAYELITGRLPFATQSLASMMGHHSSTQPALLSESVADLPPSLEVAVLKALAKDPEERFYDFSLFLEVIQSVLSPSPIFPLSHSPHLHSRRNISNPAELPKEEKVLSSASKRATKRAARLSLEQPEVFSNAEIDMAEPVTTSLTPQASMSEAVESTPLSKSLETALQVHQISSQGEKSSDNRGALLEEQGNSEASFPGLEAISKLADPVPELTMAAPTSEQEIDNVFIDPFEESDANALLLTGPKSSIVGQDEDVAIKINSLLTSNTNVSHMQSSQIIPILRSRRRALGRMLLLSVLVALITSAFWLVELSSLKTYLYPPKS